MKVIILAGGLGSKLSENTKTMPKPMVKINGVQIILRIMSHYSKYGFKEFLIATGYKGNVIKKYFKKNFFNWKINVIDTGKKTMTGGRLKRLKKYLKDESFLMTYGDGLSNVNIKKLIKFHKRNKKMVTLTAVRPPARFGALKILNNQVKYFKEKSKLDEGWINGGFFVINKDFFKYIRGDNTFLERETLEKISKKRQLTAYKHTGFWQCMDTIRDKEILEKIVKKSEKKK